MNLIATLVSDLFRRRPDGSHRASAQARTSTSRAKGEMTSSTLGRFEELLKAYGSGY